MKSLLALVAAVAVVAAAAGGIEYRKFHVESEIVSRYSTTAITSVVLNNDDVSRELSFQVQLPETAFISNFTMNVDGVTYHGEAREKEDASSEYENRTDQGENVGLVESRGTNLFTVRVHTAANSTATFQLIYEELLIRRKSKFQQVINLNPGSVVEDLQVTVHAVDQQGITHESAPEYVSIAKPAENEVFFSYSPLPGDQADTEYGLSRDLVVEYDIEHPSTDAGLFVVNDCYFSQFFSPFDLEPLPVDVVFVIDVSGSMSGRKIEQTIEALETVINQLRPQDWFTIITFQSTISVWREYLVPVQLYRALAVDFVRGLTAAGGTNFTDAILHGASILIEWGQSDHIQLLVAMTDGLPNVGVVTPEVIIENVNRRLAGTSISLNCLGFGESVNFDLLEQLALSNKGTARRIYEGNDAASQLEGFFEEISCPLLSEIEVIYQDSAIEMVSETQFPLLFCGSEIVVAGKFNCELNDSDSMLVTVIGKGGSKKVELQSQVNSRTTTAIAGREPSTERLMAYLVIRQLMDKLKITSSERESQIKNEITELALKYNFATNFTSLLVVEESETSGNTEEAPSQPNIVPYPRDTTNPLPERLDDSPSSTSPPDQTSVVLPEIQFIRDSPRVIGDTKIEAWFNIIGSYNRVSCHLEGKEHKTKYNNSTCDNHVVYTGLIRDDYIFRVVVISPSGQRVTKRLALDVGYGPHYCYVHRINQGVLVDGNSAIAEFAGVGGFSHLECRLLDETDHEYSNCTSPHVLTGLTAGSHRLRIRPVGCTKNNRLTYTFTV